MNRDDLRQLARIRLKDARALLNIRNYDGAYYLSGYVVECGLKACIAKKTRRYDFPDKDVVNKRKPIDSIQLLRDFRYEVNSQRIKVRGLMGALQQELNRLDEEWEKLDNKIGEEIRK